jgi:hypothetical protein
MVDDRSPPERPVQDAVASRQPSSAMWYGIMKNRELVGIVPRYDDAVIVARSLGGEAAGVEVISMDAPGSGGESGQC